MKYIAMALLSLLSAIAARSQVCIAEKIRLDSVKVWMLTHPFEYTGDYEILKGNPIKIGYTGRPAFIFFGTIWCEPCRIELPYFARLSSRYKNVDFIYITGNDKEAVQKEQIELKINNENENFYILKSDERYLREISGGYPTHYILYKNSMIRYTDRNFVHPNSWPGEPEGNLDGARTAAFWESILKEF